MPRKGSIGLAKFFGIRLCMAREASNISGAELGRLASLDRHQISKFEAGIKLPSLHSFVKIVLALRLPPEHYILPPENKHQYLYIGDYTEEQRAEIYGYLQKLKIGK